MKTCTFIFWISLLVLFFHSVLSKSSTNKEQYSIDSENSNEESELDIGKQDVALQEGFRPRHKYKSNGHRTRFYRSNNENDIDQEAKSPACAIMYKDNEPVGILQPFQESYRFLPVSGDPTLVDINPIPVKRKTIMDVLYPNKITQDYNDEAAENNNQFTDDRYPSIFAKFKIDSRLDKVLNPDLNLKRSMYKRDTEKPDISDEQVSSLKTTLSKMNGDNSAIVEEELKNILDDMGLIDDYDDRQAKREVAEDEDMEQGTNKINLIKEEHNETRKKRGNASGTTEKGQSTRSPFATTVDAPTKVQFEEERTGEMDSIDLLKDGDMKLNDDSGKEELEVSTETDLEESRKKRQFGTGNLKEDKGDAIGTLADVNINTPSLVKEAELTQYEKRVEREIRDKIQKLKEEVKEEIKNLKKYPDVNSDESDIRRKKRQIFNTLMDEETQDIDPNFNDEGQRDEHHVRCKRTLHFDNSSVSNKLETISNLANPSNLNSEQKLDFRSSPNFDNTSESSKKEMKENPAIEETIKDNNSEKTELTNFNILTNTTKDANVSLNIENNAIHNDCSDTKCSIHNNKSKSFDLKTKRDSLHTVRSVLNNIDTTNPKNVSFETKRKKNIIRILNVIGKKNYNYTQNNTKRFIGINPILENNTAYPMDPYHYMKNLQRYTNDGIQIPFESNHEKSIEKSDATEDINGLTGVNTILRNAVNYTDYYKSRNLKQVDADTIMVNMETGMPRKKRSVEENDKIENDPSDKVNTRIKKQTKEDLDEKDYEYNNPEFNEDADADNQAYEDQPYANENNDADDLDSNAFGNNVNSHCNCNKMGSGCKCETQKADLSVPSVAEQYYSDYVENPSNIMEKKSVHHCHCDKNGKHCKCQTFREGSEYSDNSQEQHTGIEKSADIDEDGVLDELQGGVAEIGPRRPRQRRKYAADGIMNLNKEDRVEGYYENYDIENDRLMKREAKLRKQSENKPFQNGEYFVDLHPNTYRLTPIDTVRDKRENLKDLIAIHSGGPVMHHLAAIRQRSMLPHSRIRRRIQNDDNKEPRQLIDMSDEDIFGALPQSFAGELARYKRVKRAKTGK